MCRVARIGVPVLLVILGLASAFLLLTTPIPIRALSPADESRAVAGANFYYCPDATNDTCPACAGYTSCTLNAGGGCTAAGGASGCSNAIARKRCVFTFNPYSVCDNNWANACGSSNIPTPCVLEYDQSGNVIGCHLPATACTTGGAVDCNSCA